MANAYMVTLPAVWNSNGCGSAVGPNGDSIFLGYGYGGSLPLSTFLDSIGGGFGPARSDNGSRNGSPVPHWQEVRHIGSIHVPAASMPALLAYADACEAVAQAVDLRGADGYVVPDPRTPVERRCALDEAQGRIRAMLPKGAAW